MKDDEQTYPSFLLKNAKEIFDQIDEDNDKIITKQNHLSIQPQVFETLFNQSDQDQTIKRTQFLKYISKENLKLYKLFHKIDQQDKGYINKRMLTQAFQKYDFEISESQIKEMLQNFGENQKISYKDFLVHYHNNPYANVKSFLEDLIDSTKEDQFYDAPNSPIVTLISGGISGAVSRTITAPVDRIKVIMQASNEKLTIKGTISEIYKKGNLLAFFKGNGTNVTKIMPETAIKFYTFDYVKSKTTKNTQNPLFIDYLIAGACAGVVSQLMIYPLEITKTRLALAENKIYAGIFDCMRKIVKFEGIGSLYKGLVPSLAGIVPYSSVDLALFHLQKKPSSMYLLSFGSVAGLIAQFVAYPFVVLRTKLQSQGLPDRPIIYKGFTDCIKQTYDKQGILGFYRGIIPNYMKSIPAIAINYMLFEKLRQFFRTKPDNQLKNLKSINFFRHFLNQIKIFCNGIIIL